MIELLSQAVTGVSWILMAIGGICVLIGGIGILRMPDIYTRIHASSLTDTMATLALFSGMMLSAGFTLTTAKLFAIMVFLLLTGPTATYALANAALMSGTQPPVAPFPGPSDESAQKQDDPAAKNQDQGALPS